MGIFSTIFGKKPKPQQQESHNEAYPWIKDTYGDQAEGGVDAFGTLGSALGIGGNFAGQQQAYDNYLNNSGYQYVLDQGMQGVTNSAAGKFMLRSGATAKALQDRSTNIGKTYFDNYLDRLGQMSQLGLGAGGLISNAGQTSTGTGATQGTGGIFGAVMQAAPYLAMLSDRRLKVDIRPVGELSDGLTIYDWRYRWDDPRTVRTGPMADEVAVLRPWAMGPNIKGYATIIPERLAA